MGRGLSSPGGYDSLGIDHINSFSGGLTLVLPLPSAPLTTSASYGLMLTYTSSAWQNETFVDANGNEQTRAVPSYQSNSGVGWAVSFLGRLNPPVGFTDPDTQRVTFVSADGAAHTFYPGALHEGEVPAANYEFSRDGSYARLFRPGTDPSSGEVETADGMRINFDRSFPRGLRDRFNDSTFQVTVEYCSSRTTCSATPDPANQLFWKISDLLHGRVHWVEFANTGISTQPRILRKIDWAAWNGQRAIYTFSYNQTAEGGAEGSNPSMVGCGATGFSVPVKLLTQIDLPSGERYSMPTSSYGNAAGSATTPCTKGLLERLRLPAKGSIAWQYGLYTFPEASTARAPWQKRAGIAKRWLIDAAGNNSPEWVYTTSLPLGGDGKPIGELINTLTNPLGHQVRRFFTVCGAACSPTQKLEYGLPFSRLQAADGAGRLLSVEVLKAASPSPEVIRRSYVIYERDPTLPASPVFTDHQHLNQRLAGGGTVFVDDPGVTATFAHSLFNGLGNYRKTVLGGTFGSGDAKTLFTDHTPGRGTFPGSFTPIPTSEPWLLNIYGRQSVTEGGKSFHKQACFDQTTGFLVGLRTLESTAAVADSVQVAPLGAHDLLWLGTPETFDATAKGNLVREDFLGGDTQNLPTGSPCDRGGLGHVYALRHTYQAGALATSRYLDAFGSDMPFLVVNGTIDPSTGLTSASTDVSGFVTRFEYDSSGRLLWEKPEASSTVLEDGWTEHIYTNATGNGEAAAARVDVIHHGVDGAGQLAKETRRFDSFGRPWLEEKLMRDGSTSQRETLYDPLGQVTSTSMLGARNKTTSYLYDALGRPTTITQPDGRTITLTYTGDRQVNRTLAIGTGWNGSAVTTEAVTTRSFVDRQGRLFAMHDKSNPLSDLFVSTNYGYDAENRLVSTSTTSGVNQTRSFVYDGRGLLLSEDHPEKLVPPGSSRDVEHRRYDAKGHVIRTVDGEHDLGSEYDSAERLTRVYEWANNLPVKELEYSTTPGNSLGKLLRAARHNRFTLCGASHDAEIAETHTYGGRMGRVSQRDLQLIYDGVAGEAFRQTFAWAAIGRLATVGYPRCTFCTANAARSVNFTYTSGWLSSVAEPGGAPVYASNLTYHPNGLLAAVVHGNNTRDDQANDPNFMVRPSRISTVPAGGGTALWDSGTYLYDAAGNVVRTGAGYFLYDKVSRLDEAQLYLDPLGSASPVSWSAAYDSFGNVQSFGGTSGRATPTDSATNRLCGSPCGGTAGYSACGELLSWSGQSYAYEAGGMLQRTTIGGEDWLHFYTAEDERIWSYRLGGPPVNRWTLRDLDGQVLTEYLSDNSGWQIANDYVYREGLLLAAVSPTGTRHFHLDHLGTPRAVSGPLGTRLAYHAYYPFGEEATSPTQDQERMKLTGHEWDLNGAGGNPQGDDLGYLHARHYNPLIGRFLSTDPVSGGIEESQSWNLYTYTQDNPVNSIDSDGLYREQITVTTSGPRWRYAPPGDTGLWGLDQLVAGLLPTLFFGFLELELEFGEYFANRRDEMSAQWAACEATGFQLDGCQPMAGTVTGPPGLATGLRGASAGLTQLFKGGLNGKSIIGIRSLLLRHGFKQGLARSKDGYRFVSSVGEEVRIMRRGAEWVVRVQNRYGNYLDASGNVAAPAAAHAARAVSH